MKALIALLFVFGNSCVSVHTRVTSTSAVENDLSIPVKLFWILPEDDLLKQQQTNVCKNYFSQNASVINQNQDCADCLNVVFYAGMGGSDTSSVPLTKYNTQTNMYYQSSVTNTEHERIVELKFFKGKKLLHQIRAVSWGSYSNINRVLPEMCLSIGNDFPQDRRDKLYEIDKN